MTDNSSKNLTKIFHEALDLRGLKLEKLSELTNIPEIYLTALYEADFEKLPSSPYTRGYIMKIAEVLKIDGEALWQTYKNENIKISGAKDKLPINRFLIKPLKKRIFIFGFIATLIIVYSISQIDNFIGTARIKIVNPAFSTIIVNEPNFKLSGKTDNQNKLTINNENVFIRDDYQFKKEVFLQPGINTIEFKVKKLLGKETKIIKQIIYQPQ